MGKSGADFTKPMNSNNEGRNRKYGGTTSSLLGGNACKQGAVALQTRPGGSWLGPPRGSGGWRPPLRASPSGRGAGWAGLTQQEESPLVGAREEEPPYRAPGQG